MTQIFRKTLVMAVTAALLSGYGSVSFASEAGQDLNTTATTRINENMPPVGMPPEGMSPMGTPPEGKAPKGAPPDGMQPGKQGKSLSEFTAVKMLKGRSLTLLGGTYAATKADQNAILVKEGGKLSVAETTLKKTGDTSSPDGSNFSGQNAVFLAADSTATIKNSTISSTAEGANGIFATGKKAKITVENVKINTTKNSSRGLDATYDGTIIAKKVDINTKGAHCAALATDRGEGTVTVSDSRLRTAGEGSPCVYSTGNITLTNSIGLATGSEIAAIEGKNSITLNKVDLRGAVKHGIMLYQSFSGDAETGTASLTVTDSKLASTAYGPMFYVTNTKAETTIVNSTLNYNNKQLIKVAADHWGQTGANGGDYTFTAVRQALKGDIYADGISTVRVNLQDRSQWDGAINTENEAKSAQLHMDKDAVWNMTGTSHLAVFTDKDTKVTNVVSNGYNIIYDASNPANGWLHGRAINLAGGGRLMPLM